MIETIRPLDYAKQAVEMMMEKFDAVKLPPERFHYHQGVFLSGVYRTWKLCRIDSYFQYMKEYVDHYINEDGTIRVYDPTQLDDIQPGILIYPLLDATGEEKYKKALDILEKHLQEFPRCECGGYWHKVMHPYQMWLDGLYMAGPLEAEYSERFGRPDLAENVVRQAVLMWEKTRDEKTGLMCHAWDESRKEFWADPETGRSPEIWGRSVGWVPNALLDDLDHIDPKGAGAPLVEILKSLLPAVCRYQDEEGYWYQIIDKADREDNWREISCTCLFTCALAGAVRRGILPKEYLENANRGYEAVIKSLVWDEHGRIQIGGICIGTGVGEYPFYAARPVCTNDLHGVGAFLLMCAEMEQVYDEILKK